MKQSGRGSREQGMQSRLGEATGAERTLRAVSGGEVPPGSLQLALHKLGTCVKDAVLCP